MGGGGRARGQARGVRLVRRGRARGQGTRPPAKLAAERALEGSGLPYTILRPGLFAANYADLARRIEHNGSVFLPGRPDAVVQPIHGRDVALCALASLDLPAVRNATVDLGGPDTMTHAEALATMCGVAGIPEHHWALPPRALEALSRLMRPISPPWRTTSASSRPASDTRPGPTLRR